MAKRQLLASVIGLAVWAAPTALAPAARRTLDPVLPARAESAHGVIRVIVRSRPACVPETVRAARLSGQARHLAAADADLITATDRALVSLSNDPCVLGVSPDRRVRDTRTGDAGDTVPATLARWVRENLGVDGTGVGIAMLDSGVTAWHDDLTGPGQVGQRVVRFVDFVNQRTAPYDDYGHGTHVAGILAGNGTDSEGQWTGIAPRADLIALKVLDENGDGYVSDVISAIEYAITHREELNIRVMNVSVAAEPTESYRTDPLTLAARRAVDAGIVVVAAAGNLGSDAVGKPVYGRITAPGNAPWVLTVGASMMRGGEEFVASFSSRGPTRFDFAPKPDIVAPGVGLVSLSEPGSSLYRQRPSSLRWGTIDTAAPPYFTMSGTSMAAPVVSGTIALMIQANPALTPAVAKGILQHTATWHDGWSSLEQGAGFLDARAAVMLSRSLRAGNTATPFPFATPGGVN
jgi:serine protease AprX